MKQDRKEVAHAQDEGREVKWIATKYNIPFDIVNTVMYFLGKDGKYSRSRAKIYKRLREIGYVIGKKKSNENTTL